jgi:DNA-binding CsgD family transcriptional regulator
MRPVPILLSEPNGHIQSANDPAIALLGPCQSMRCCDAVRAEDAHGHKVCEAGCAASFHEGEQRDQGVVKVRGLGWRLVCSAIDGAHVIALIPAPFAPAGPGGTPDLSPREKEVLALVAKGLTSHRIARRLEITTSTVRTHVEHIRDKLGVRTRSQAVARAMALGQIE